MKILAILITCLFLGVWLAGAVHLGHEGQHAMVIWCASFLVTCAARPFVGRKP